MIESSHRYDIADPKYAEFIYHYCQELYPESYFEDSAQTEEGLSMLEWVAYAPANRECFETWLDEYFEANPECRPE